MDHKNIIFRLCTVSIFFLNLYCPNRIYKADVSGNAGMGRHRRTYIDLIAEALQKGRECMIRSRYVAKSGRREGRPLSCSGTT